MSVRAWNTLTRRKEDLEPLEPPRLRLFVCGPTVYGESHLGHAKTYTQFDLIARHLRLRGFDVEYVQNITDVDDKIVDRARGLGITTDALARRQEVLFREDMQALGNTSVDTYARAGDYIPQIISQVERLVARGHAYELPDGFYFDIASFPDYGKLAGRTDVGPQDSVSRVDENPLKRHPGDFVLWKRRKPGDLLRSAASALRRLDDFYARVRDGEEPGSEAREVDDVREAVLGALDDDFDTPAALAILFQFVRAQNGRPRAAAGSRALLGDLDRVFGVLAALPDASEDDAWVTAAVQRRDRLRRERRFAEADKIRERLRDLRIVVEDTGASSRWYRKVGAEPRSLQSSRSQVRT